MVRSIILLSVFLLICCEEESEINSNAEQQKGKNEYTGKSDFPETNFLDSIRYELSLNNNFFMHLDCVIIYLDVINFSHNQVVLVDTFYSEFGIQVRDKYQKSPVIAYWAEYVSKTFDRPEEVQARKIPINPQEKIRISYRMTDKLDFELRNKIVPKGEYSIYYTYGFFTSNDSLYKMDSTEMVKFYLDRDCHEVKN